MLMAGMGRSQTLDKALSYTAAIVLEAAAWALPQSSLKKQSLRFARYPSRARVRP
jgi:hypothetical protein